MELIQTITKFNQSARKAFGADINVSVARAPAFGDDDVCLVVQGSRQIEVARDLLKFVQDGRISMNTSEFMGVSTTSTVVHGFAA